MKQHNQIGKYTKKESVLLAKKGKTFVTNNNKTYQFDYEKIGKKYHFIILYLDKRWFISESDFNRHSMDDILNLIESANEIA